MSNTANIACYQFNVKAQFKGAVETILAVPELSEVFSPPHHGPRDIPIRVQLLEGSDSSYVHFPIVRTGRYAVYLDTPDVFEGMFYSGTNQNTGTGTEIPTEPTSTGDCRDFAQGFMSSGEIIFNQNDPQPIAIRLSNRGRAGTIIHYIVSLFEG
ncbi:MAG: hypothetical protein AAGG51_13725 [Cyanobacteria bacterium P01_G01_bin.54]